jgi:putative DNA primase/helicase
MSEEDMINVVRLVVEQDLPPLSKHELTEQRVGRRFAEINAHTLRYNHSSETWLMWNGNLWTPDGGKAVDRLALDYVLALHKKADPSEKPHLTREREKRHFARAASLIASVMLPLATEASLWDRDPWLLGTPAGVVDLRTGELRPGKPDDMISKSTAIAPSERAHCPRWKDFLKFAHDGNEEVISFLQRYCGYCLTGLTREEVLVFLAGKDGTGKGTFTKTICGIMRDYAGIVPVTMFTDPNWRALEYYRAQLPGLRLVLASEPGQDTQWNEGFVNEITGSDRLSARHPRGTPFSFDPTHKLMMHGNSVPDLKGAPSGIRRRLRIALFDHAPVIADTTLKDKLRVEWPDILRWMIDGCLAWQRDGLNPPEAITKATKDYFEQQDTFARFIADRCNLLPSARLQPNKLRSAFNDWAEKNGEPPQSSKAFHNTIRLCRMPHVKQEKVNGVRWIFGIAFKPPQKDRRENDDGGEPAPPAAEMMDDLPYTGPVVDVPDPLDEHGAPQPAKGGEPGLSRQRIHELADWYADEGSRRHNEGTLNTPALDADLRAILHKEVAPQHVDAAFERIMLVVFAT